MRFTQQRFTGLIYFYLMLSIPVQGQIRFSDVTKKAGLIEPLKGMMGHGAAWGDVNGDGFPDLFFGTFSGRPDSIYAQRGHGPFPEPDKLFLSRGDGTFEEVLDTPIRQWGRNSGAAFADFDNDGDLDLVVSHNAYEGTKEQYRTKNFLFANDGTGVFTDVTEASGLDFGWPFTGRNTFVFDYNGDGKLDILMQEDYLRADASGGNSRLMKNTGGLHFQDVTAEAGFPAGYREGLFGIGGFVGDINGDTWPDVFFAHSCRMFINNCDGTFREKDYKMIPDPYREAMGLGGFWTCGADLGDLDNDGDLDLVMGEHFPYDDTIQRSIYVYLNEGNDNEGNPILKEISGDAGLLPPGSRTPHVQLQDLDNDGHVDIMFSSCRSFIYPNSGQQIQGVPQFETPVGSGIEGGISYWAAGPLADYDRDGRLDFIGPEWEPAVASPLLKNRSKGKNYLAVRSDLKDEANRNAIGALVEVYKKGMLGQKEGLIAIRQISVSNGYSSGYEAIAYFGLPEEKEVDVRLSMPCTGKLYSAEGVQRNQMFVFK